MENQPTIFELALKTVDEMIVEIDTQHNTLQSKLNSLVSDRAVLLGTRKALLVQLGEIAPAKGLVDEPSGLGLKNPFKGMGLAAAARKYLAELGLPRTHAEVVDALLKGNVKIASKHPGNSIRSSMQKHPDWFRWVKPNGDRGHWELIEWPLPIQQPDEPSYEGAAAGPNLSLVPQKTA